MTAAVPTVSDLPALLGLPRKARRSVYGTVDRRESCGGGDAYYYMLQLADGNFARIYLSDNQISNNGAPKLPVDGAEPTFVYVFEGEVYPDSSVGSVKLYVNGEHGKLFWRRGSSEYGSIHNRSATRNNVRLNELMQARSARLEEEFRKDFDRAAARATAEGRATIAPISAGAEPARYVKVTKRVKLAEAVAMVERDGREHKFAYPWTLQLLEESDGYSGTRDFELTDGSTVTRVSFYDGVGSAVNAGKFIYVKQLRLQRYNGEVRGRIGNWEANALRKVDEVPRPTNWVDFEQHDSTGDDFDLDAALGRPKRQTEEDAEPVSETETTKTLENVRKKLRRADAEADPLPMVFADSQADFADPGESQMTPQVKYVETQDWQQFSQEDAELHLSEEL